MNDTFLTFPADRTEALAMLYLQNLDLAGKRAEELADLYLEAKAEISRRFVELGGKK